ncbi:MAG TPA: hypothetical protein VHX64_04415 [Caulobacteraceae bacterium]|jgi:hypothetical protein|nr:hypothetical protein [Caulobacteraceae bacterium]
MVSRARDRNGWRLAPAVLLLGLALRVGLALNTDSLDHPDEIFQYLEQAHRLVFKWGFVPWEYQYGIRSWIIPGFLAGVLEGLRSVGLDSPDIYQPAIKIVLCVASLSLPLSLYRVTQAVMDETAARIALVLASIWYELIYYAHKPLADALSAYALYGALALLVTARSRRTMAVFGGLCGLTIALRFQLAPAIAAMLVMAALRWRKQGLWALAGLAVVLAGSGLLDAYSWGRPFSSIWSNVEVNLFDGIAASFGTSPVYYYVQILIVTSLFLVIPGVAGLYLWRRTAWPLIVIGLIILIELSLIGHKEPRFIFPIAPLYIMGLAGLAAYRGPEAAASQLWTIVRPLARAAPLAAAAVSVCGLLWILPVESKVYVMPLIGHNDVRESYLALSRLKDVSGLIDQSGGPWWSTGGYFDLNQPVPIYRPDLPATRFDAVLGAPERYASHWLTPKTAPAPHGYYRLRTIGDIAIWRRARDPRADLTPAGYSTRVAVHLATPPKVTPRS